MAQAGAFLAQLGIPLDIKATVGSLPFAYRQMTEIAKALMGEVRLLILDEPTSSLTSDEVRILFDAIEKVTRRWSRAIYVNGIGSTKSSRSRSVSRCSATGPMPVPSSLPTLT